jgi:general stress protein 26
MCEWQETIILKENVKIIRTGTLRCRLETLSIASQYMIKVVFHEIYTSTWISSKSI